MGRRKINIPEMGELIRAGKTNEEIATHFGVTVRAVQKQISLYAVSKTKYVMAHHAKEVVAQNLDAWEQVNKINSSANRLLDMLEEQLKADHEAMVAGMEENLEAMDGLVASEPGRSRMQGLVGTMRGLVQQFVPMKTVTVEQLFRAQAEIRQQVGLLVKVSVELLEANRVNEVHRIIMDEVGKESPECQGRIVKRLKGTHLLFSPLGLA